MKELITWSDRYNLGIAKIDSQHQKMIGIINTLYRAMGASIEKEEMSAILQELIDYANYHFATEEEHFKEFNYEDTVEHIKAHDMYRERISKFTEEYFNNAIPLPFEMMDFLSEWWTGHIQGTDRKYVPSFHEHGMK